jgi:hypothetical protein
MSASLHFSDNRYQKTEIEQISDIRRAAPMGVCQMSSAKFLPNVICSLQNQKGDKV